MRSIILVLIGVMVIAGCKKSTTKENITCGTPQNPTTQEQDIPTPSVSDPSVKPPVVPKI